MKEDVRQIAGHLLFLFVMRLKEAANVRSSVLPCIRKKLPMAGYVDLEEV